MKIEITKTNPYVVNWQGISIGEENGKNIFELTEEETKHFIQNSAYYKVKAKKLFFDESYKNKIESKKEENDKAQKRLKLRVELCNLKDQKEKFEKYNIVTEELENKIIDLEIEIKELGGELYIKNKETGGENEI